MRHTLALITIALTGCGGSVISQWEDCGCSGTEICVRGDAADTCVALPTECTETCGTEQACDDAVEALCGDDTFTSSECIEESDEGYGHVVDCEAA
ncbi:MAG: hypothetical protein KTR31_35055 [Myxococcales bacterium]|nr:hypothetical protein [Myxococcales bacterium]